MGPRQAEIIFELSTGVSVTWQAAAVEAAEACYLWIEPHHLFLGVVSVEKIFKPAAQEHAPLPAERMEALQAEWDQVRFRLERAGVQAGTLRRQFRRAVGMGDCTYQRERAISRSDASRAVFKRAANLARAAGASRTELPHMLAALVEDPRGPVCRLLAGLGVDGELLRKWPEGGDDDSESTDR